MANKKCTVDGCDSKSFCRTFCTLHYSAYKRHGSPYEGRRNSVNKPFTKDYILENIYIEDTCWVWKRFLDDKGYGVASISGRGKHISSHRMSYILWNGTVEDGTYICHKCDNPPCCNPEHLYAGTHQDNTRDMMSRFRFHSKLTKHEVEEIRMKHSSKKYTQRELGDMYSVSESQINKILKKTRWKYEQ